MSLPLNINGIDYFYPETGDLNWGPDATDWAQAVTTGMLQKAGGLFLLLNEVDFGPNHGLKSIYYKSRSSNIAASGVLRLSHSDTLAFRNNANNGDLALSVNSSDELLFNGQPIGAIGSVTDTDSIDLTLTGSALSADLNLSAASATGSNLKLTLSIESDGLLGQIEQADSTTDGYLSATDWTTFNSKQAALGFTPENVANKATDLTAPDNTKYPSTLAVSNALAGFQPTGNYITALTGDVVAAGPGSASAAIQSGVIVDSMISASAAIAFSKLAALTSGNILVGNGSNVATSVAMSGDVTISNTGVTAIGANKVTNAQLAQVATQTFKGRTTASTGDVEDLSTAQATAMLDDMVGDSGSGGTKGLVPAPAAGDAAANKYLKADGTWTVVSAGPTTYTQSITNNQSSPTSITDMVLDTGTYKSMRVDYNVTRTSSIPLSWTDVTPGSTSLGTNWRDIAFGAGVYAMVGSAGANRVLTSPDGITWTARAISSNSWNGVCFGNSLFVAVGNGGTNYIATSPDGITWTNRTSAASQNWRSVAYNGSSIFVAVSSDGTNRVQTSANGTTSWTLRTAGTATQWQRVIWANSLFVAVGSGNGTNTIMTSPNGTTWTTRTAPSTLDLCGVAYGNSIFVAIDDSGTTITSTNGTTWSAGTSLGFDQYSGYDIIYANSRFMAFGSIGGVAKMAYSTNGTSWTIFDTPYMAYAYLRMGQDGSGKVVTCPSQYEGNLLSLVSTGTTYSPVESGSFQVQYNPSSTSCLISARNYGGDDSGISLTVNSSGQVSYTSTNFSGQTSASITYTLNPL